MKKVLFAIICLFCVCGARAANENAATSKEYVDTELATKQPTIPAAGNDIVMTFDSTATDGIGTKQIYDETASYATQENTLVTAATANAAVQMAINGEFICTRYDPDNPTDCWWWGIQAKDIVPNDYTRLEYIETTGTQYIDTGMTLAPDTTSIKVTSTVTFLRRAADYANGSRIFYISTPNSGVQVYTNGTSLFNQSTLLPIQIHIKYNIETVTTADLRSLTVANNTTSENFSRSITDNSPLYLFGNPTYAENNAAAEVKLYTFRIYKNYEMARNFIPVRRNSDNVVGLYDTVTQTFFINQGSDNFIAGPINQNYLPSN